MAGGHSHRGTLKKDHKPFKSKHASKGQLKNRHKGKVEKTSSSTNPKLKVLSKLERKNLAKQLKNSKILETKETRKIFEGQSGTEKIVTIICLTDDISPVEIVQRLVSDVEASIEGDFAIPSINNVKINRFKSNLKIIIPDPTNLIQILDSSKISDFVVFGISAEKEVEKQYGEQILRALIAQGIASVVGVLPNIVSAYPKKNLQQDIRQSLQSFFNHFFPAEEKLYAIESESECLNCIRMICQKFPKSVTWRDQRGYIVADSVSWSNEDDGLLVVEGTVRGAGFNANRLVHIPGYGDFQLSGIEKLNKRDEESTKFISNDPETLEDLNQEEVDMDYEDWDDYNDDIGVRMTDKKYFEDDPTKKYKAKALPKGTSDYQGRWYLDDIIEDASDLEEVEQGSDDDIKMDQPEEGVEIEEEEEEEEATGKQVKFGGTEYEPTEAGDAQSEMFVDLDPEEEARQYQEFKKAAEEDLEWPDEIELDPQESGKKVLANYRGIKSLANCEWDYDEHDSEAPSVWKRLLRVQNYKATRNRLNKEYSKEAQVNIGNKARIYIRAPGHILDQAAPKSKAFVIYGLLEHEHKQALVNFSFESWEDYEEPIASRQTLIVQYGPRRQVIQPIFNQASNNANNVHKFERFHHPGNFSIATCMAPVLFNNAPSIFFKQRQDGSLELVGQGTFLNCDHTRIVAERAVLTGHAVKIHKKVVTVRYMFFNAEDVNWFKAIPLFTKSGRSGFIKESLGTHGYFKATFDGKLSAQDVIGMSLYKRVWPEASTNFVE